MLNKNPLAMYVSITHLLSYYYEEFYGIRTVNNGS